MKKAVFLGVLFFFYFYSSVLYSQDKHKELVRLSKQSLAALALGDVVALQKMLGQEAIVGVPCSGKVHAIDTKTPRFGEIVISLQQASQNASRTFANEHGKIGMYETEGYKPFKKGDIIVTDQTCTWGLVFRLGSNDQPQLKGFFFIMDQGNNVVSKKHEKKNPPPKKPKKDKKKKKPRGPLDWRIFFYLKNHLLLS